VSSGEEAPGTTLVLEARMSHPAQHPLAGGWAVVYSTSRPGDERPNQDGAAIVPLGSQAGVLMVADGVGGTRAGGQAAAAALDELAGRITQGAGEAAGLRGAILDGFEAANQRVLEIGGGAATTLAAVEVDGGTIRAYHVGDSAVLLLGQRGRLKLQTIEHSPVGFAREAGLLDEDQALRHEERHLVSNVVGTAEMRIEVGASLGMAPRDTLILASDGLTDNLRTDEIASLVCTGPLLPAAHRLAAAALERMVSPAAGVSKPDDLTFILFRRPAARRAVRPAPAAPPPATGGPPAACR
jgi:serine/threonine protein phosphatase PrpC